ncbi:MAG: CpsD/CapB family tyrosine-protein kinase [Thermoanaerobaculia bacterium]
MSKVHEALKRVDGVAGTEASSSMPATNGAPAALPYPPGSSYGEPRSPAAERMSEIRPNFSVLQLPAPEWRGQDASELDKVPIHEVTPNSNGRLVYHTNPNSAAADRFRYLRMRLREIWRTGKLKTLLITSPLPQDGKSMIAINLATALAERGTRKLLLVDADMHHSSITHDLGLNDQPGLAESLENEINPLSCVRRIEPLGWYLLPAGRPVASCTELLQTEALPATLRKLTPHFDWIIIDSPPVIPITDPLSFIQYVDGVLLVARAGQTSKQAIEDSIALLGRKRIIGLALNVVKGLPRPYSEYCYPKRANS